jgi:predicted ATPase
MAWADDMAVTVVNEPVRRTLPPTNLPEATTSFVGRWREVAEVVGRLAGARLLTLTGPGGIGKTRLASSVAAQVLADYDDGVWLVELAPLSDPARVPAAIASAIGVREEAGRPLVATIAATLKGRRMLLVLDNCEHMVEAVAAAVATLLRGTSEVRVLAGDGG